MLFLKPVNKQVELTFTTRQREQLREAAVRWIESEEFEGYFRTLHLPPWTPLFSCLFALATVVGLFRMRRLLRIFRESGTATRRLRQGYLELARTGQVVWGQALGTAADFRSGRCATAKARVLAAAEGTPAADKHSIETMYKFFNTLGSSSNSPLVSEIRALAGDVAFELFRVRPLPPSFTGKVPVYLFEVILHRSTIPTRMEDSISLVCLANPGMRPSLLGIPADLAQRTVKEPGVRLLVDRSLRAR